MFQAENTVKSLCGTNCHKYSGFSYLTLRPHSRQLNCCGYGFAIKERGVKRIAVIGALWIIWAWTCQAAPVVDNQDELARAAVLARQGAEKHQQGSYTEAEHDLRAALAIRERYLDKNDPLVGNVVNDLGATLYYQSRFSEAEPMYKRAIQIFAADPRYIADEVSSLANLASLYREQRRMVEAEAVYDALFQTFNHPSAVNELTVASVLTDYGMFEKLQGNLVKAEESLRRSAEIRERRLPPGHPNIVSTWTSLGDVYYTRHEYAAAESMFRKSVDACEHSVGADDRRCAPALNGLALTLAVRGMEQESEKLFQRALVSFQRAYGPVHARVAAVLNNLGTSADRRHDYKKAEKYLNQALEVWNGVFGPDHPDVASGCSNLASVYMHKHEFNRAEPLYQRALVIDKNAFGPAHAKVAVDQNNLAVLYGEMKRFDESQQYFRDSIHTYETLPKSAEIAMAGVLVNYGLQMWRLKRFDDATPLYRRALSIYEHNPGDETPAVASAYEQYATLMRQMQEFAEAQKADASAMRIRVRNTIGNSEIQSSFH